MAAPDGNGRPEREDLDPLRQLVLARCRQIRLTLADASRQIGRNESYIHQFIYRGSPKNLPEAERVALANLLGLPESQLRKVAPSPLSAHPQTFPPHSSPPEGAADVPVFSVGDSIDVALATEWTKRPALLGTAGPIFALWVMQRSGRFREGDMVFVRQGQPPRVGEPVAVIDGQRVLAIGDLAGRTEDNGPLVSTGGELTHFPASAKALKIAAAAFP